MAGRRRRSREIALQVLCQMEASEVAAEEAFRLYSEAVAFDPEGDPELAASPEALPFAEQLVTGVSYSREEIDALISSASEHWRLERMSVVDRNVLRIALFEMLHCGDIPPKVSINEAIDIGKTFGAEESGAFINGVLDNLFASLLRQGRIRQAVPAPDEAAGLPDDGGATD